jgi:TMEM175 potassium channel family protein
VQTPEPADQLPPTHTGIDADTEPTAGLERFIFFSDAVIAIAMTLLALDLKLPAGSTDEELWRSFYDKLGDNYFAFALSFLVITVFWSSHHRLFREVVRFDAALVPLNMVFLFLIVVLPFSTRLIAEHGDSQIGTVVYAATVTLTALTLVALAILIRTRDLARDSVPGDRYRYMARGLLVTSIVFAISIPITFIADPGTAKWSWLVLSLLSRPIEKRLTHPRRSTR